MIKRFFETLQKIDPNQRNYWFGLSLLFAGLTWSRIGLTVVGAVLVIESTLTSYLVIMLSVRGVPAERK